MMKYLDWNDVKDDVKKVNNELYEIIEEIKPTLKIKNLFYNYGDIITDKKYYYERLDDFQIITHNANDLPLMLMIKGVIEIYLEFSDKIITYDLYEPGNFFPYTNDIEFDSKYPAKPYSIYHYHAGLKNISMLPMGAINANYLDLAEKYNINPNWNPEINSHQYEILKTLIIESEAQWQCRVLAFDDTWKKEIYGNPKWHKLKEYMLKNSLLIHSYRKSTFYVDYVMHLVAKKYRGTKNQEYIFEVIKNIMLTALGDVIGLAPVTNNDYLPYDIITQKFIDGYGAKYTPAIIAPKKYNYFKDNLPVYYSLYANNDTLNDTKSFQPSTYLETIHQIIGYYLNEFSQHELTATSAFGMMKDKLHLKYYAQRGTRGGKTYMNDASQLVNDDQRFKNIYQKFNKFNNYSFPRKSNFSKALISIQLDKN